MYELILENQPKSFIRNLKRNVQEEIFNKLDEISKNPRSGIPLVGRLRGLWEKRIGAYRILYRIRDMELIVLVVKVGHRKNVFK